MKRKLAVLVVLLSCMAFVSCHENEDRRLGTGVADMSQAKLPILYGIEDYSNAAVLGLGDFLFDNELEVYCTGILVHPNWVLTAAHCVSERNAQHQLVPYDYTAALQVVVYTSSERYQLYDPERIISHPEYDDGSAVLHDLALIKLKQAVPRTVAEPILPHPKWLSIRSEDLPVDMTLSGFGYDENGNKGGKRSITRPMTAYCGEANGGDSKVYGCHVGDFHLKGCHPNAEICEQDGEFDQDYSAYIEYNAFYNSIETGGQCNGDSGGPALYAKGGVDYVSGITSYGDLPCRLFNVSTSVQDYYDWIISMAPEIADQYAEVCGNGVDDDGNGLTDDEDPVCIACGNGVLDVGEACDGEVFAEGRTKCSDWDDSYGSGKVTCSERCRVQYDSCIEKKTCGNGMLDDGEVCDGNRFSGVGAACSALFPGQYDRGNVKCTSTCEYDTTDCHLYCGNGAVDVNEGEACDHSTQGDAFAANADTCEKVVGYGSTGTLGCSADCREIITSACSAPIFCGNGVLDADEKCDGTVFVGERTTCVQWDSQYVSGNVKCRSCEIDYSECRKSADGSATGPSIPPASDSEAESQVPDSGTKKSSSGGCSSSSFHSPSAPVGAFFMGVFGLGILRRRRRMH